MLRSRPVLAAPLWLLLAGLGPAVGPASADEPFAAVSVRVPGRPVQVASGDLGGGCRNKSSDWLVISVSGTPPDESRAASVFACGPDGAIAASPRRVLPVPADAVAYDLAPVDGAPGKRGYSAMAVSR